MIEFITRTTDFFTKYAVFVAFLGFGLFFMFQFIAMAFYANPGRPWNPETGAFSDFGSIYQDSKAAGFSRPAWCWARRSAMPVVVVYLREMLKTWKQVPQVFGLIGFLCQLLGRVFGILIGAFPTTPWGRVHDDIAYAWLAGELIGSAFIAIEMLRGAKVNKIKRKNPDLLWGIMPFVLIVVGIAGWTPYFLGIWRGVGIPEIFSILAVFAYSIALWIRAWMGNASIGPARGLAEPAKVTVTSIE